MSKNQTEHQMRSAAAWFSESPLVTKLKKTVRCLLVFPADQRMAGGAEGYWWA